MKLYMVVYEGLVGEEYGTEMYLLGIYDNIGKAHDAIASLPGDICTDLVEIHEVELNETLEVTLEDWFLRRYKTKVQLGSYLE